MPANRDWDLPIHFYYGNAAKDLKHMLPPEEELQLSNQIVDKLSSLDQLIDRLEKNQKELNFFIQDIRRFLL